MLYRAGKTMAVAVVLISASVAAIGDATVDFMWMPANQTVNVGDTVAVELWAFPTESVEFNSAQAVMTWDPGFLDLTGNIAPAYPPPPDDSMWNSEFRFGDSFGLNEASPLPQDGDGLWIGEVDAGETLTATTDGILLSTIEFEALAETPATEVAALSSLQLPGHPTARSKFNVGTYNVLDEIGAPAVITIVPEPAGLLGLLVVGFGLIRRR